MEKLFKFRIVFYKGKTFLIARNYTAFNHIIKYGVITNLTTRIFYNNRYYTAVIL